MILLEQQPFAPTGYGVTERGFGPGGVGAAYYDAIVAATSAGITVVEAAGNGDQNPRQQLPVRHDLPRQPR